MQPLALTLFYFGAAITGVGSAIQSWSLKRRWAALASLVIGLVVLRDAFRWQGVNECLAAQGLAETLDRHAEAPHAWTRGEVAHALAPTIPTQLAMIDVIASLVIFLAILMLARESLSSRQSRVVSALVATYFFSLAMYALLGRWQEPEFFARIQACSPQDSRPLWAALALTGYLLTGVLLLANMIWRQGRLSFLFAIVTLQFVVSILH